MDIDTAELRKLAVDLKAASGRVGAQASAAVRKVAFDIEATAKSLAPVRTGNLRGSIQTDIRGDGRSGSISAEISAVTDYAVFVEHGTSRMRPQPFLGPAFDRHAPKLEQALGKIGEDLL